MCGIGGILRIWPAEQRDRALQTPHDQSIPELWLNVIDDAIKHRGPDGQGRFRDRTIRADGCVVDVALVHRRLSIIDHAGGHQPMVLRIPRTQRAPNASSGTSDTAPPEARNTPGRILTPEDLTAHNRRILAEGHDALASQNHDHIAVVFNGCIYNHRELRSELQRAGHVFHTDHSDTEVLVHGWREWGFKLWGKLDGMYSVGMWDSTAGDLVSIRDRFCEKPLVSMRAKNVRVFASTTAALLRVRRFAAHEFTQETVRWAEWCMQGYSAVGLSDGIEEEWPSWLHGEDPADLGERWFQAMTQRQPVSSHTLSVEEADRLLTAAVSSRLEADVPIGCLLSGGVDSSLIAAIAKRHINDLRTFTVRMPSPEFDESQFGEVAARAIGSKHTTVSCDPNPVQDLHALIAQSGVPFGDSSLLPTHWAARAVGSELRVALTGDGGDELFYGYDRFLAADRLFPFGLPLALVPKSVLNRQHPKSLGSRLARLIDAARAFDVTDLERIFPKSTWHQLLSPELRKTVWWCGNVNGERSRDVNSIGGLRRYDLLSYLPFDLLRKADMASMAVPIETRSPMLAVGISSAALNAKISSLKLGNQRKGLLRQVARKYLPAEIVDRPKMGFAIPIGEWFRTDYGGLRTMLLDHLNSSEPFGSPSLGIDLNMAFIRQMLDEHLGTGPSGRVVRDHSQRLYMLLVLSIWAKWVSGLK